MQTFQSVHAGGEGGLESWQVVQLHVWLGVAWVAGCVLCGLLCLQRSRDCSISRQYLCQACLILAGVSILTLNTVRNVIIITNSTIFSQLFKSILLPLDC